MDQSKILEPRIHVILAEKRLQQNKVADQLGVTTSQFNNWVRGVSFPRALMMFRLASVLGVSVDELYKYHVESDDID